MWKKIIPILIIIAIIGATSAYYFENNKTTTNPGSNSPGGILNTASSMITHDQNNITSKPHNTMNNIITTTTQNNPIKKEYENSNKDITSESQNIIDNIINTAESNQTGTIYQNITTNPNKVTVNTNNQNPNNLTGNKNIVKTVLNGSIQNVQEPNNIYKYDYQKGGDPTIPSTDYNKTIITHNSTGDFKYNITAGQALQLVQKKYPNTDWTYVSVTYYSKIPEIVVTDSRNNTYIEVSPNGELMGGYSVDEVVPDQKTNKEYKYDYQKGGDPTIPSTDYNKTIITHNSTGDFKYNITAGQALQLVQKKYPNTDWTYVSVTYYSKIPEIVVTDSRNNTYIEVSPNGELMGGYSVDEVVPDQSTIENKTNSNYQEINNNNYSNNYSDNYSG